MKSYHEFVFFLRLQYKLTTWVQMVHATALTCFMARTHKCLINDFPNTRVQHFERFVKWHRLNASNLVAEDEDLQRALEKMETSDHKKKQLRTLSHVTN